METRNPMKRSNAPEPSLDPKDWDELRELGQRMVKDMVDYLKTVRDRPLHRTIPENTSQFLRQPVPHGAQPAEEVYDDFLEHVLPYPHGNIHPRFWGWVVGTGTPFGMLADMLAAGMNSNSGFGNQAVIHVESQVIRWLREALGLTANGGGSLTSGCSIANLSGLTVARDTRAPHDIRSRGLQDQPPMAVYGSSETHSSNHRALEILGLGRAAFRTIPVDGEHRIVVAELERRIREDHAAGVIPVAVIGNAGTVNIGAFDDLEALAAICGEHGVWLHVDGAFGALAALAPRQHHLLAGLEKADSVAFDLHKWLHIPYDAGAVLFKDPQVAQHTFQMTGAYLSPFESGVATGPMNYMDRGLQMSRGFRALKVWMSIKHFGIDQLAATIQQNIEHARYLAGLIDAEESLELLAPVPLNIVNFRFSPPSVRSHAEQLDRWNRQILLGLHEDGVAAPSHTNLDGQFSIRAAITNHRSRFEDFDVLVREVVNRGKRLIDADTRIPSSPKEPEASVDREAP